MISDGMYKYARGTAAICLLATAGSLFAARGPRYSYGEAWWREYNSDDGTELLLHFGPPADTAQKQLVKQVQKQRSDEMLDISLDDLDGGEKIGGVELPSMTPDDFKKAPVDESNAKPGMIFDYSDRRCIMTLPDGMEQVDNGRFGKGAACSGTGALRVGIQAPRSVECSFRFDTLPETTVCLFSVAGDESRLLLHPDGRLELKLRKPHGNPGSNPNVDRPISQAAREQILAKDATIISPEPVSAGEWNHVVVYNQPHPTPGGGEPWDARLKVNGFDVAWYLSERYNDYHFMGRGQVELVIGNSLRMDQAFTGTIDEFRVSTRDRIFYERPVMLWRDTRLIRPLDFDKPYFRKQATVFHASLDQGRELDLDKAGAGSIMIELEEELLKKLLIPGIRGKGWVIDPEVGFPRIPLKGLNSLNGAVEFWMRPVNWDDTTGYWHHTPPDKPMSLSVVRFYGRDTHTDKIVKFMEARVPRCRNLERRRWPVDPGHWMHVVAAWHDRWFGGGAVWVNGDRKTRLWRDDEEVVRQIEPLYVEFGVDDGVKVKNGERPLIEIDEIVGYDDSLASDEIQQAMQRWKGRLEPIKLYMTRVDFKWSLQRLDFTLNPLLPEGAAADAATVFLTDADGKVVRGPLEMERRADKEGGRGSFYSRLNDGQVLPYDDYVVSFQIHDDKGTAVIEESQAWEYKEDPWRHCRAGILDFVPEPWTPLKTTADAVETRMTRYVLGEDGLPHGIFADGVNLLAGAVRLIEGKGARLSGKKTGDLTTKETHAEWAARFEGDRCDLEVNCRTEYDGMLRFEIELQPKSTLRPLRMEFPLHSSLAKRLLYYPIGARGVSARNIEGDDDALLFESRVPSVPWREFKKQKRSKPDLTWEQFRHDYRANRRAYGAIGHLDINDMNRGLFWFCDNLAGWQQSKEVSAIEVRRESEQVILVLNLVAEAVDYKPDRPIVFGILPHPARPHSPDYRYYERAESPRDPESAVIFDAFRPWPMNPKAGSMQLFPATDPKNPKAGASWEYAESCIPSMKAAMPRGYRTMYLSKKWFSCRAGAFDGWEWRSGKSGGVSLTPSFVNYLCWEMNEWIGRGIWTAIYLDECYEEKIHNLASGMSVRLPDGTHQPGTDNFQFRELMKRWRNIFHAHDKKAMFIAHHTRSWQYPGLVFADACLDGENTPIVSLNSRDWIDSTSKARFEVIQNSRLWGTSSFYMPFISEGGFGDKGRDQFPKWQWRMARQAQSQFAHYEVATVYEGQGSWVYNRYWDDLETWGALDPQVAFHPYWDNERFVDYDDAEGAELVSLYRQSGKVLLIGSNRQKEEVFLRIKLDVDALGLEEPLEVQALDSSYSPPAGEDYVKGSTKKQVEAAMDKPVSDILSSENDVFGVGGDSIDDFLLDENQRAEKEAARTAVRIEDGNVLVLPIRPRDFRMVTLE
ncbi:MAG: DUF6067 family protein [Kiritimatiellia bacterium]